MRLEIYTKYDRVRTGIIKVYDFIQYTDVFNGIGNFTMTIPYTEENLLLLIPDNYILFDDKVMGIITKRKKTTEEYTTMTITGKIINRLFEYRSFLLTTRYNGVITDTVRKMVNDLIINNVDKRRNINYIKLSEDKKYIPDSESTIVQKTGKTLNEGIEETLALIEYGYELVPIITKYVNESKEPTNIASFEFRVLKPVDRSIGNKEGNNPVVFGMPLNNLSTLIYEEDKTEYCSTAIIAGEGEGQDRITAETGNLVASGIDRIELYVDARDLQREYEDGTVLKDEDYLKILKNRGNEYLEDRKLFVMFDGTIVSGGISYKYEEDFYKGDYVSLIDEQLNVSIKVQITKVTKSDTKKGEMLDVTFGYEKLTTRQLMKKRGLI